MSILNFLHSGGNKVSLTTPTSNPSSNVTFKLPAADGTAGQVLQTDGNGNLTSANMNKLLSLLDKLQVKSKAVSTQEVLLPEPE